MSSILAVRNLSKAFGGVHAVDGVSFDVAEGEFLAMIGPNGAGKSTCFNIINGQLVPDAGDVRFADRSVVGLKPRERNELIALVKRLVVERQISVLFTEHSMDVVFAHADRILVLARGVLIADGDAAAIRDNRQVQEVYLGTGKTFTARPEARP